MPASFFRAYPPCKGDEPYLYLCFHQADASRVKPFLDGLFRRRCRVWYTVGDASDSRENRKQVKYEQNADLMVFWLSERADDDEDMKSALGYYQTTGRPVICIDTQTKSAQSGLSLILSKNVKIVTCEPGTATEELVSTLMRTEGFSQQLIAEDDREQKIVLQRRKSRRIALSILLSAVLLLGCAIFYAQSNDWFRPQPVMTDSVTISDPQIARAARFALAPDGKAALTRENLAQITVLRLYDTPASFDELALFPGLSRLEIPQSSVEKAAELLDGARYTIVVYLEAAS